MNLIIEEMNTQNQSDLYQCSNEFIADARLCLCYENGKFHYTVEEVTPFVHTYARDEINLEDFLNGSDGMIYLAYVDGELAGQIIINKWWNQYAYITDFTVEPKFRGKRVGVALMSRAERWAREHDFPGIMLETQNYNVKACKFYETYGFRIGGFDLYAYKGIHKNTREIPIYWYYIF